jgi:hypothetical protein
VFNRTDGFYYRLSDFDVVVTDVELSPTATLQDAMAHPGAQVVHYNGTFPVSTTVFSTASSQTLQNIKHVATKRCSHRA